MKLDNNDENLKGIRAYADKQLAERKILTSPYFQSLQDGTMTLEQFRETQKQFYFAVLFFSRPMAGLLARFPSPKQRLDLLRNLVEEHGDFKQDAFHETTFRQFLLSIGVEGNPETVEGLGLWPELRAFNSILATACMLDELEVGVACIGIIEYAFADISSIIGKAVVDRGWVSSADLVHYKLHAEIDKRHADEFFELVCEQWSGENPERRYFIEQGLALGAYCFDNLYRDLYSAVQPSAGEQSHVI
jgi:pyrroloquinoline-quinone synthase